jgi:hypothetical protein
MNQRKALLGPFVFLFLFACSTSLTIDELQLLKQKLDFDIRALNEDGLFGPEDGLVALDYEFCIPNKDSLKIEIKSIDPTIKLLPNSNGRINCEENSILCIGNTHQENYQQVLVSLARLEYISVIRQTFYELH